MTDQTGGREEHQRLPCQPKWHPSYRSNTKAGETLSVSPKFASFRFKGLPPTFSRAHASGGTFPTPQLPLALPLGLFRLSPQCSDTWRPSSCARGSEGTRSQCGRELGHLEVFNIEAGSGQFSVTAGRPVPKLSNRVKSQKRKSRKTNKHDTTSVTRWKPGEWDR